MKPDRYFDEDSELVEKAQNGDRGAFGELVERFQGPIYNFTYHFFRDPDRAQDVTQDTFLKAFRFLQTYDLKRRFSTWLYTIARNLCIDRHRESVRRGEVDLDSVPAKALEGVPEPGDPLTRLEDKERRERLLRALGVLPEKYRTPIVLCYMEGLPYQEIADILGISLNNTKIRIFRAKRMILDILERSGGTE